MSSNSSFRLRFEQPIDVVNDAYASPAYFERMANEIGGSNVEVVEQTVNERKMRTTLRMHLAPITPLPAFARKIISGAISITQTIEWNAESKTGSMQVTSAHLPYKAEARMRLEAAGAATDVVSDWTITIKIPLVSGALERLSEEETRLRLQAEASACGRLMAAA